MNDEDTICPVCGYLDLFEPAYVEDCGGSYEICPSCGFQFGVSDDDRHFTFESWREKWVGSGMRWQSHGRKQPPGWDPHAQLTRFLNGS